MVKRILHNPFVTFLPIVALLLLGWHQYIYAAARPIVPASTVLPNSNLESVDAKSGLPTDWQATLATGATVMTQQGGSGESSHSVVLATVHSTPIAGTALLGPKVTVQAGVSYFYKSFYTSTVSFDLMLRTYGSDGSYDQVIIGHKDAGPWSTVGYAFTPHSTATIQFVYSLTKKGLLTVGTSYLEPQPRDIYNKPQAEMVTNDIPNATLTQANTSAPEGWSSYSSGDNQASFDYMRDESTPYLRTVINHYKNGEGKWQYVPVAVHAGQVADFAVTYRSSTTPLMIAEYLLSTGKRQFVTLEPAAPPTQDWTTYLVTLDVPPSAVNVMVGAVLQQAGTLDTKNYRLTDRLQHGAPVWSRPLVSYTFDDGWESAYVNAIPQLDEAGYTATLYLNPAAIDTTDFMTSDDVADLHTRGYEIASHGNQHLDFATLDAQSIDDQLWLGYQYVHQIYGAQTVDFAPPFGSHDAQVDYYVRRYYASQRGTEAGINNKQSFDPYNLRVLYIGASTPLATLTANLAEAKAEHAWLILVYHQVDDVKRGEDTVTINQFRQQLATVESSAIHVATIADALREVQQQE